MSRSSQKKLADQAFSRYIRARDPICRVCGVEPSSQAAHVWPRSYHATRFDPRNAIGACGPCHLRMTHSPAAWDEYCELNVPHYRSLRAVALSHVTREGVPSNKLDYLAIARMYEGMV